jgi:DNA mismatch endonuclease (patch repair protein)
MTDVHTTEQRRRNMAAVRSRNTGPEMLIRRGLHGRGFRYSLHHKKLPGHPDIVLTKYKAVMFVHGCFWHGHGCRLFRWPASRPEFWRAKILRNRQVDAQALAALRAAGWRVLTVWECALKGKDRRPFDEVLDRVETALRSGTREEDIAGIGSA